MKSIISHHYLTIIQENMYLKLEDYSKSHKALGYIGAIPVATIDIALDTIYPLLGAIESLAMAAINLFGAAFSSKCKIKHSIECAEDIFKHIFTFPISLAFAIPKVVYQTASITNAIATNKEVSIFTNEGRVRIATITRFSANEINITPNENGTIYY